MAPTIERISDQEGRTVQKMYISYSIVCCTAIACSSLAHQQFFGVIAAAVTKAIPTNYVRMYAICCKQQIKVNI